MQNLPMAEPLPPITDEVHILIDAGLLATVFGWVVSGVLRHGNASGADEVVNLNCTTMDISQEEPSLQQFWDLEAIGINSNEKESDFVRQHFDETVQRNDEDRYTVSLPFNSRISKLDTNLDSAISQLASTLKSID
uniref:Peptidase aspartic putative domain-containing protein n=1 Tax=Strigamia maritima TaxID=126957 RepID=T1J0W4_STRMM